MAEHHEHKVDQQKPNIKENLSSDSCLYKAQSQAKLMDC
jgi:hypothetical protein